MKTALLVMTYGSPETYTFEGVAAFYTNICEGRRPTEEKIQKLYEKYRRIGSSPLQEITRNTVEKLAASFAGSFAVYFANKFSSPKIDETIARMEDDGIENCLCLILEPYYSMYSVMGYEKWIKSSKIKFNVITSWHQEKGLIAYWAEELKRQLAALDLQNGDYEVIFTAHSVPKIAREFNDPYLEQIAETVERIVQTLDRADLSYTLAWQSASDNGMEWIGPDVLDYLREHARPGKTYLFAPIGFISDHIETYYDIDVECRELCAALHVQFQRVQMPNTNQRLLQTLIDLIQKNRQGTYRFYLPEDETAADKAPIILDGKELKMPYFVKKLIEKKGRENVKMPEYVRKMLIKAGRLKE